MAFFHNSFRIAIYRFSEFSKIELLRFALNKREFDIAICGVLRTPQMAKNGKNRLAILTIFRFCRTDVK
jgi:hypothetical protein